MLFLGVLIVTPFILLFRNTTTEYNFNFFIILFVTLIIYNIPFYYLLISYYFENKNMELRLENETIFVTKNSIEKSFNKNEVLNSTFHIGIFHKNKIDNINRTYANFSDLGYWELEFIDGEKFYLTNLIVNFLHQKPILDNTEIKYRIFPYIIRKKSILQDKTDLENQENILINRFLKKFKNKTPKELEYIISEKNKFQKEAIKAAELLLNKKSE